MKIIKLELLSKDLTETTFFYSVVLGFEILNQDKNFISFRTKRSILQFNYYDGPDQPFYHFAFDIPSNCLQEAKAWLDERVELFQKENNKVINFPNWNAKSLYFLDNNSNVLEYIARYDNVDDEAESFNPHSLVSISEIGLVTNDLEGLANQLQSYGLEYFHRQKPGKKFAVVGDDNGLLILSAEKRTWFPSDIKVKRFPLQVIINDKVGLFNFRYDQAGLRLLLKND